MPVSVYADDLRAGMRFPSGSYTVSAGEIVRFAREWDPLPMHTDPVAADAGFFGGLIASGIHTFAIWQRLAVLNIFPGWQIIAGRDVTVSFPAPVRAGATVSGELEIESIVVDGVSRGLVTKVAHLVDDDGERVFEMRARVLFRRRPAPGGSS